MIAFRPMEPRDRRFVVEAWIDSSRDAYASWLIPMGLWAEIGRRVVESILDRPAQVIVAHDPEDPDPIADLFGFIAFDATSFRQPYVYYVYVKQHYRRGGIARRLFSAAAIDPAKQFLYAGNTRKVRELAHKVPLARWDPLLARFPLAEAKAHDAHRDRDRDQDRPSRRYRAG